LGRVALQVFQTSTLREALSVLSECEKLGTPVGLLVLGIDEGSEEAAEALHCFRQWRNGAELPVFVVSGKGESNWKLRFLGEGANEYFAPPWEDGQFRMQAQQALRTSGHVWRLQQEKQNAERLLQQQKSALATKDLWRLDLASRTLEFNENCREFSGYMPEEIGNALDAWLSLVHPMDLLRLGEALSHTDWQGTPEDLSLEFRLRNPQGGWRWILIRGRLEKDELGNPVGLMGSHTDITQAKITDSVTGIPNRFHFDDWLQQNCVLQRESLAVFLFGLDRFHLIRDSLGAGFADHLLRMMGERLRSLSSGHELFREAKLCIARVGSDEFALAMTGVEDKESGKRIAELIESQLSKGIWIDGKDIFTSISAGYAVRPASAQTKVEAREVWRDAEIALHSAKAAGGARTIRFDGAMRERVVE
jgi:diguanylate cyclase (GGDEF)-like protein/PAS domain S-box-containing protein